ncbi:MAG: YqaJ viral recombinase family protein [Patescibacteria group bacterium]|nr:YqaJ viral recombinase family protein [Patescibacteria group bacterium]
MSVEPNEELRAAWLAKRRQGVSSSDIAAVCGLSPWGGALDVYLEKLGLVPPKKMTKEMEWGLLQERVIAARYTYEEGRELTEPPPYTLVQHPECAWWIATPDRLAADRVVELKTSRYERDPAGSVIWGEPGTDLVPIYYHLQVIWQMLVTGLPKGDIAVLIAGADFRVYHLEWNQEIINRLMEIADSFHDRVQRRDPPPVDWADPRATELLEFLHSPEEGKKVELDESAVPFADQYQQLGRAIGDMEKSRQEAKGRLIELMEDAQEGLLPDGRRVKRETCHRKGYMVEPKEYVDFRILKPKKERSKNE